MPEPAAAPVFVSYQRGDVAYARFLAKRLAEYGGAVWWDRDIQPGQDWRDEIVAGLDRAAIVVLLHSGAAERSEEVQKELAVASARHKILIAVRLENRLPQGRFLYEMAALNWIDAWRDPETALDALARRLTQLRPGVDRATVADDVGARSLRGSALARIIHSWSGLLAIWSGAMITGLIGQGLVGEGIAAQATERGLSLGDALIVVAAFVFAPLAIVRYIGDPPRTIGAVLVLGSALVMGASYVLIGLAAWRALRRWLGKRQSVAKGGRR